MFMFLELMPADMPASLFYYPHDPDESSFEQHE